MLHSDDRLTFAACWGHARRKVVEATTYPKESELLLGMIQALYDIETRGKDLSWQDRQALRQRESTVVLEAMWRWLEIRRRCRTCCPRATSRRPCGTSATTGRSSTSTSATVGSRSTTTRSSS